MPGILRFRVEVYRMKNSAASTNNLIPLKRGEIRNLESEISNLSLALEEILESELNCPHRHARVNEQVVVAVCRLRAVPPEKELVYGDAEIILVEQVENFRPELKALPLGEP